MSRRRYHGSHATSTPQQGLVATQTVTQTANSLFDAAVDNSVQVVTQTMTNEPTVYAQPPLPPPTDAIPSTTTYTESHTANLFTQFQNDLGMTTNTALEPYTAVIDTANDHADALGDAINQGIDVLSQAGSLILGHAGEETQQHPGHFSTFKDTVQEKFQTGVHEITHPFSDKKLNLKKDLGIVLVGAGILFILLWKGSSGARQSAKDFVSENMDVLKEGAKTAVQYAPQALMMAPLLI